MTCTGTIGPQPSQREMSCSNVSMHTIEGNVAVDNECQFCHAKFDLTRKNTQLILYLLDASCNHAQVSCPNGHVERIYMRPSSFLQALKLIKPTVNFANEAPDDMRNIARAIWAEADGEPRPSGTILDLPELPSALRRQLHDYLRTL